MTDVVPVAVVRQMVKAAIDEALNKSRIPKILSGSVEDLDADTLDVAYVRMDQESMGSDPTQSDNWGSPGVVATTRLGTTNLGEQVRVTFDGSAGGSASLTAAPNAIVLPFGQETGNRIILDGAQGLIIIGDPGPDAPGARIEFDPVGGIRIRSEGDVLVGLIDQAGYTLRDSATGLVVGELKGGTSGSFRLVDPIGTDDIEMVTSSIGTLPNPKYTSSVEASPGATVIAPAAPPFTISPPHDYEFLHAAAGLAGTSQAATWTPPAGTIERFDTVHNDLDSTLSVACATRVPATGAAGTFTSTASNWLQGIGTHVVVRGGLGGGGSPNFRATSEANYPPTNATNIPVSLPRPTGVVQTDVMVALVSMLNNGGSVPTGWNTPEGWIFLGANFLINGSGATQSTLAVGAWTKLATATEPADYDLAITFGPGEKRLHAGIVAISDADLIEGGAHIRMGGHPIRRLIDSTTLTAPSGTLCDFQNIPGGFDHLELVWDAKSDRATDALRNIRIRLNVDAVDGNYRWQTYRDGVKAQSAAGSQNRIIVGALDGRATACYSTGRLTMIGYTDLQRRTTVGESFFYTQPGDLVDESSRGLWLNTTDPITRVDLKIDTGSVLFDAGSRAYLYGY